MTFFLLHRDNSIVFSLPFAFS